MEKVSQRVAAAFLSLLVILLSLGLGNAQERPPRKIRYALTSLSAADWIPWIAKEAKIYEKHGLDVELVYLRGSGQSAQAIIGGAVFAGPVTTVRVLNADLSGGDLVTVAHTAAGIQSKWMVRPEIKRPQDLIGKKMGTSGLGSLGDFLWRSIMKKYGIEPDKDVTMISIRSAPDRLQALRTGVVDAADLSFPVNLQGERLGFRTLWDAKKEIVYPSLSVVTRRKYVQEDRDTVLRLVRAHVEGISVLKANKEFSLKVLRKGLKTDDRDLLESCYEIYHKDFISVPYPITKGLRMTYEYVALKRPDIWSHKPDEFVDSSFISELDKNGFIKHLYEKRP